MGHTMCKKYGVYMIRHPFSFLQYLIDFSINKLELCIDIFDNSSADDSPEIIMPLYDERAMESITNIGLGMYMDDPLTTANFGKIFVD